MSRFLYLSHNGKDMLLGITRRFHYSSRVMPLIEVPFLIDAFNREHKTKIKLMSAELLDSFRKNIQDNYLSFEYLSGLHFPIDAFVAYEKPGKRFDNEIHYSHDEGSKTILPTGRYKGEKDIALVILDLTADDLQTDGTNIFVNVPDERLTVVPDFPKETYRVCISHGVLNPITNNTCLYRNTELFSRLNSSFASYATSFFIFDPPNNFFDVNGRSSLNNSFIVVEVSEEDKDKFWESAGKISIDINLPDISADELERLINRFSDEIEELRTMLRDKLLVNSNKLESFLKQARFKSPF